MALASGPSPSSIPAPATIPSLSSTPLPSSSAPKLPPAVFIIKNHQGVKDAFESAIRYVGELTGQASLEGLVTREATLHSKLGAPPPREFNQLLDWLYKTRGDVTTLRSKIRLLDSKDPIGSGGGGGGTSSTSSTSRPSTSGALMPIGDNEPEDGREEDASVGTKVAAKEALPRRSPPVAPGIKRLAPQTMQIDGIWAIMSCVACGSYNKSLTGTAVFLAETALRGSDSLVILGALSRIANNNTGNCIDTAYALYSTDLWRILTNSVKQYTMTKWIGWQSAAPLLSDKADVEMLGAIGLIRALDDLLWCNEVTAKRSPSYIDHMLMARRIAIVARWASYVPVLHANFKKSLRATYDSHINSFMNLIDAAPGIQQQSILRDIMSVAMKPLSWSLLPVPVAVAAAEPLAVQEITVSYYDILSLVIIVVATNAKWARQAGVQTSHVFNMVDAMCTAKDETSCREYQDARAYLFMHYDQPKEKENEEEEEEKEEASTKEEEGGRSDEDEEEGEGEGEDNDEE